MNLRIKEIAKKKGLSLDDTAKKIGITYTAFYRRIDNPKLSTLQEIAVVLNCSVMELLETPAGFMHLYDDKTGEWLGIIPKPVTTYRATPQELASIDKGPEDVKAGRVFSEVEAEMEKILKRNKITLKNSLKYEQ